jgi:hypothetical protein
LPNPLRARKVTCFPCLYIGVGNIQIAVQKRGHPAFGAGIRSVQI